MQVDNLIQGCILAAAALTPGGGSDDADADPSSAAAGAVAAGRAYFLHDDSPQSAAINNFEFFRPLVEGLGYSLPTLRLSHRLVYCLAWGLECVAAALLPVADLSRVFMLTRAEVHKAGRTHTFSVERARRELGYAPWRRSWAPVVRWFLERGHGTTAVRRAWLRRGPSAARLQE